jgi:GT2 family glycosyltransferase
LIIPLQYRLSILVLNRNTKVHILDFLSSISFQNYPKDLIEIIVLDNGSTDGSQAEIRWWFENHVGDNWLNLKLVENSQNIGIADGYNEAFNHCSLETDIIVRGESDVLWEEDLLIKLVRVLANSPDVGVVAPIGVLNDNKEKVEHAARYINWWTGSIRNITPSAVVDCDDVLGSTFLVRKSCINRLGYFYKQGRFLANELEFCTRVKKLGYRVVCQPTAVAYHKVAQTSGQINVEKFLYIYHKETVLFHLEFNRFPNKITTIGFMTAYSIKKLFLGSSMPFRGIIDGLLEGLFRMRVKLPGTSKTSMLAVGEWILS